MISFQPAVNHLPAFPLRLAGVFHTLGKTNAPVKALVEKEKYSPLSLCWRNRVYCSGKLLDVELEYENMRWIYEIRSAGREIGRVSEYWFDAQVGERISQRTED